MNADILLTLGSPVRFAAGGPRMLVTGFYTAANAVDPVECGWFDGGQYRSARFNKKNLVLADDVNHPPYRGEVFGPKL